MWSGSPKALVTQGRRYVHCSSLMAHSRFDYVRNFEQDDRCLPNTWIVVRIDGKGFHKFSEKHGFKKPNDENALNLMTAAATRVLAEFKDIILAYGQSDEYSFVLRKKTESYKRRASKLMTTVVSLFASSYVFDWSQHMSTPLLAPPAFDARVVLYPSDGNLRDYLSWRQADCHINNLHNTCFWALVQQSGLATTQAMDRLKGTVSTDKHELLFSQFNINYNNEPEIFKKGTVLLREKEEELTITCSNAEETSCESAGSPSVKTIVRKSSKIVSLHVDIIKDTFWKEHPDIIPIR